MKYELGTELVWMRGKKPILTFEVHGVESQTKHRYSYVGRVTELTDYSQALMWELGMEVEVCAQDEVLKVSARPKKPSRYERDVLEDL